MLTEAVTLCIATVNTQCIAFECSLANQRHADVWRLTMGASVDSLLNPRLSRMDLLFLLHCGKTISTLTHLGNLLEMFLVWVQVCPVLKWGPTDPNWTSLLFLQLSRVLRLLKYPAEDSENPPQVNMSLCVSEAKAWSKLLLSKTSWSRSQGKQLECLHLLVIVC